MGVSLLEREQLRPLFPTLEASLPASIQMLGLLKMALWCNRPLCCVAAIFDKGRLQAMLIRVTESGPVYTYAQTAAAMRELLRWDGPKAPLVFPSFQDEHLSVLREFIASSEMSLSPCKTFRFSKLPELPPLPEGDFTFGALTPEDIPIVLANWPYSKLYPEGGVLLVTELIASGPTMCARVRGVPVCWMVTYQDSSMGMLHTLTQYRRTALALQVVVRLSRALLERGLTPYCHVRVDNNPSLNLFTRLGFMQVGDVSWVRALSSAKL